MTITKEIELLLKKKLLLTKIYVTGNNNYLEIIAVSEIFCNMNNIQRQQSIYAPLTSYITKQIIHSVSIKTYSVTEWEKLKINAAYNV